MECRHIPYKRNHNWCIVTRLIHCILYYACSVVALVYIWRTHYYRPTVGRFVPGIQSKLARKVLILIYSIKHAKFVFSWPLLYRFNIVEYGFASITVLTPYEISFTSNRSSIKEYLVICKSWDAIVLMLLILSGIFSHLSNNED